MRIWTLHPKYLDAKGLVALWRETLLAQKVLAGKTKGYRNHPQLIRFNSQQNPLAAVATYLCAVHEESLERGYSFDRSKISRRRFTGKISETTGQVDYEWTHLMTKLKTRDPTRWKANTTVSRPDLHPLFRRVSGRVRDWEVQG